MRYIVFIISTLFLLGIIVNLLGLNIGSTYQRITNYGFGYITGNIILLLIFASLVFYSARIIFIKDLKDRSV